MKFGIIASSHYIFCYNNIVYWLVMGTNNLKLLKLSNEKKKLPLISYSNDEYQVSTFLKNKVKSDKIENNIYHENCEYCSV